MTQESPYIDYGLGSILFVTAPVVPTVLCSDMSVGLVENYMTVAIQIMSLALLVVRFRKHLKEDEKE